MPEHGRTITAAAIGVASLAALAVATPGSASATTTAKSAAASSTPGATAYAHTFAPLAYAERADWTAPVPAGGQVVSYWFTTNAPGASATSTGGLHGQGAQNSTASDPVTFQAQNYGQDAATVVVHYLVVSGVREVVAP